MDRNFRRLGLLSLIVFASVAGFAQQKNETEHNMIVSTDNAGGNTPDIPLIHKETVTVTAPGEVRTEQSVDGSVLLESAAGTSPVRAIAKLPSVNFTTADPYGSYEWATRISVRGFNQNQLGFTLDDMPLGDMSYGNWNGLHISRAAMDENIGRMVLSQGTGSLDTASNSNLGGTIRFYTVDPSDKRSFSFDQAFGSFNAFRSVGRIESGLLSGHTKFYISGVYQNADKWKGAGDIGQNYWQLNGKLVKYFGSKGVLTTFMNYSDRREVDYQDLSKAYVNKLGYNFDNYGNWAEAIQAAYAYRGIGAYPGKVATLTSEEDPVDAAYYAGAGLRKDFLGGINYKLQLTSKLLWKTTVYGHWNAGRGLWFTPYVSSPNGSPIALRTSEYGIAREGFLSSLAYETGRNKLEGGVWYEHENFDLARRLYSTTIDSPSHSLYEFPTNPFYTLWAYNFGTNVYQIFLQDSFKATERLTLSAGFKTIETNTDGKLTSVVSSSYAQGSLESGKPFLPQFGANYKMGKTGELFADVSYNVRSYQAGGPGFGNSPWGTTQAGFDYLKTTLKPETSWNEEIGYRLTDKLVNAEVSYFHVNFRDRLLAFAQGPGILGGASVLSNVGGVTTNGFDAAATVRLGSAFTLYNSITFSRSTYDQNAYDNTGAQVQEGGKLAVDSPEWLYKNELAYHKHGFNAHISSDYMAKRYYTYLNDGSVDGRFLADAGLGYECGELGAFQNLKVQLNIYNLFNEQYYSSIGTNGFFLSDPKGLIDTLQVGSPRAYSGTISVRF